MADYTPLDITSIKKKFQSDGNLTVILVSLVIITLVVIGFIVYLVMSKY
jgi:hypothetical protein